MNTIIEFAEDMTLKKKFVAYAKYCVEGGYDIENEKTRQMLTGFFHTFEDTNTGAIVHGNTGTGKTFLFQILNRIISRDDVLHFRIVSAIDAVLEFNIDGHEYFRTNQNRDVLYDDLGAEDKGMHFGDRVEVFERLIQKRYDLWKSNGVRTFFTTNLSGAEIEKRYGTRVTGRIGEMCTKFILNDGDKRQRRNFKEFPQVLHRRTKEQDDFEKSYAKYRLEASSRTFKPMTAGQRLKEQFDAAFAKLKKA